MVVSKWEKNFKKNSFNIKLNLNQKNVLSFVLISLILSSFLPASIALAAQNSESKHFPGRLLIKFRSGVSESSQDTILHDHGAKVADSIAKINVKILNVPENALDNIESALRTNSNVEFVEKDLQLEPTIIPDDTYFSSQWHLSKIQAPNAWDISKGSNTVIAILDTGVDPNHPDLKNKLLSGYNAYDGTNNWSDVCGHGTYVAGTAAAITNNGLEVAGVAWDARILPIRITDASCYSYYSTMAKGIVFAADNGARVANLSFHIFGGGASTLSNAAKYMYDKGGWVVAAAGNTGKYESYSENPYIISVGATSSDDNITSFSSYGPYVDFAAPGSSILTTKMGGSYGYVSGTSFSSPITAGLVALLFSANPSMTSQDVYDTLKASAVDLGTSGRDDYYGWGRVDAYKALQPFGSSPVDNTPPTVSIVSPGDGSSVSGTVTVTSDATDNTIVSKVQLYIDNVLYGETAAKPYGFLVDSTKLQNSAHLVKAVAYDASGNTGSSQITVNVSNLSLTDNTPPTLSITSPTAGSTVSGRITVSVSTTDNVGIKTVQLYIDGKRWNSLSFPYTMTWNTRNAGDGTHTILATAFDSSGNSASTSIQVTVANRSK